MHKYFLLLVLALVISGCSTPYQKSRIFNCVPGGYQDYRVDNRTFGIVYEANGFTTQQQLYYYLLRRAAELCQEHHFNYFMILTIDEDWRTNIPFTPKILPTQTMHIRCFEKSPEGIRSFKAEDILASYTE